MGAIVYSEFHSTPAGVAAAIKAAILESTDWDALPTWYENVGTVSTGTAIGATTTQTTLAAEDAVFKVGDRVRLGAGTANEEVVVVTSTSSVAINHAATAKAHSLGETVELVHENTLKATAPSGTQLVLDVGIDRANAYRLPLTAYRVEAGGTPSDPRDGFLRWYGAGSGATTTMPVHVLVAAGPDFVTVTVEGPRTSEPNVESSGPLRNTAHLGVIETYDDAETVVPLLFVAYGTDTAGSPTGYNSYVSRDAADTTSWVLARLGSIAPPGGQAGSGSALSSALASTKDGERFFWPFVVCENDNGPRGRLARMFFGGWDGSDIIPGMTFTYDGLTYLAVKLIDMTSSGSSQWVGYQVETYPNPVALVPISGTPA